MAVKVSRRWVLGLLYSGAATLAVGTPYAAGSWYDDATITHFDPEKTTGQKIGILFSGSKKRLNEALKLYDENKIDILLVVGTPKAVATAIRKARVIQRRKSGDQSIRNNRQLFFIPAEKNDTWKDARDACKSLADIHAIKPYEAGTNLIVITSGWHALRCNRYLRYFIDAQDKQTGGFKNCFNISTYAVVDDAYTSVRKFIKMQLETFYRGGVRIFKSIQPTHTLK